jgi:hypothetical protein
MTQSRPGRHSSNWLRTNPTTKTPASGWTNSPEFAKLLNSLKVIAPLVCVAAEA